MSAPAAESARTQQLFERLADRVIRPAGRRGRFEESKERMKHVIEDHDFDRDARGPQPLSVLHALRVQGVIAGGVAQKYGIGSALTVALVSFIAGFVVSCFLKETAPRLAARR
jgi:hypothetical protein